MTRKAPNATSWRPANARPEPETTRTRPPSISSTPRTTSAPRTSGPICRLLARLRRGRVRLDDDRRPVGDDLRHRPGQLARVEAHRDDGVPAHEGRVLDQ